MKRNPLHETAYISPQVDKRNQELVTVLAIAIPIFGNIPLLGIPGAIWLDLADPIANYYCNNDSFSEFGASAGWGAAIMITLEWPASFILAYWYVRQSISFASLILRALSTTLLVSLFGVFLALMHMSHYCH